MIIAGAMASRGINFATYKNVNWHITHQILLKADSSTCSTISQAQRICGNYLDDMPLKLYTSLDIKTRIEKSHRLTGKLVSDMSDNKEYHDMNTNDAIKQIPILEGDIPAEYVKQATKKLFIIKEEKEEEFKEEAEWTEKSIQYSEKLFKSRSEKPSDHISTFLKELKRNYRYSKTELFTLLKTCKLTKSKKVTIPKTVTSWSEPQLITIEQGGKKSGGNNYGRILRRNQDRTYQLDPVLNDMHQTYFG